MTQDENLQDMMKREIVAAKKKLDTTQRRATAERTRLKQMEHAYKLFWGLKKSSKPKKANEAKK